MTIRPLASVFALVLLTSTAVAQSEERSAQRLRAAGKAVLTLGAAITCGLLLGAVMTYERRELYDFREDINGTSIAFGIAASASLLVTLSVGLPLWHLGTGQTNQYQALARPRVAVALSGNRALLTVSVHR